MKKTKRPFVLVADAVLLATIGTVFAACGDSAKNAESADTANSGMVTTVLPPVIMRPPAPGDSTCPRNGLWQPCALVDRIVHAGLSFKPTGDTVRVPFLPRPGVQYRVALTDTMVVFFFDDSLALQQAIAPLDTLRMAPATDSVSPWPYQPVMMRSGNMLALYFASNARQIERIKLAITAGAPYQP